MLSSEDLIKDVFGDKLTFEDIPGLSKRAIICPLNEDVDGINYNILDILEEESKTYFSVDSMNGDDPNELGHYAIEFLNTLKPSGMASHELKLKKEAIIMLLRNLNSKKG